MKDQSRIGSIQYSVGDVVAAKAFYGEALGLAVKFQDSDRYVAMDAVSTTLALVNEEEDLGQKHPVAAFRVSDLSGALAMVKQAGGRVVVPEQEGPHEFRAVAEDPWGNAFILYAAD